MNLTSYNYNTIEKECESLSKKFKIKELFNKKVLVTGANGLIGSFLCDFFVYLNKNCSSNIKIIASSYSNNENASRIKHLFEEENFSYFSWDCSKNLQYDLSKDIDLVFFCSGYGQPGKFLKNPTTTVLINTVGPKEILEHLLNQKQKSRFMFLSSSEIYGSPPPSCVPTQENYPGDYDLNNKRECYKQSKKMGEVISKAYHGDKITVKIARIALTYGPGALFSDKRVLQEFIFKSFNNKVIEMLDEGSSLRNYLYITDAVNIMLNILFFCKDIVYNVGNDQETTSIFDLAKKIGKVMNVPVKKGKKKLDNAPDLVYLSMEKYKKDLNLKELKLTSMDEGIKQTIQWFKNE